MSDFLQGKLALVTGGNRGIGLAVAKALAWAGAEVVVTGRDETALKGAVLQIEAQGGRACFCPCDVSDESQVLELFAFCDGRGDLDILINNAGIGLFGAVAETSLETWERVMGVNLRGPFLCGRESMKRMAGRGGRIINVGSVVSLKGYPNQGAYSASKHGLLGLTKVMAVEGQAEGIIVQAICPGGVDTEMVGDARPDLDRSILMTAEDVAEAVLFQLSQQGNAITDIIQLRRRNGAPFA